MRGWRARCEAMAIVAVAAALCSCSATMEHEHGPAKDTGSYASKGERFRRNLAKRLESQILSPAEEAAQRQARAGDGILQPGEPIWVQAGKSRVIQVARPIKRISIGNPDAAGVVVLGPRSLLINAKEIEGRERAAGSVGTINGMTLTPEPRLIETSLVIWDGDDTSYDTHSLVIADFINQQVMLDVTVAELRRTAMEQYGIDVRVFQKDFISSYFMGGGAGPGAGILRTVPTQGNQPLLPLTLRGDAPTYAFILPNQNITAFIQALENENLATVLAQPRIVAMSGQHAVFQVGGEIPIRISSGFATDIVFKPFGTLVTFVPRVSEEGDIQLTVTPEVSQPDFANTVEGIPSFITRRASTSTRMRSGQTLVIGGLLQKARAEELQGVPYLKDLPGLGYLFRTTNHEDVITEMMVVVTAHLVQPMVSGTQVGLPTDRGPLTREEVKTQANPAEVTRPRIPGAP